MTKHSHAANQYGTAHQCGRAATRAARGLHVHHRRLLELRQRRCSVMATLLRWAAALGLLAAVDGKGGRSARGRPEHRRAEPAAGLGGHSCRPVAICTGASARAPMLRPFAMDFAILGPFACVRVFLKSRCL